MHIYKAKVAVELIDIEPLYNREWKVTYLIQGIRHEDFVKAKNGAEAIDWFFAMAYDYQWALVSSPAFNRIKDIPMGRWKTGRPSRREIDATTKEYRERAHERWMEEPSLFELD